MNTRAAQGRSPSPKGVANGRPGSFMWLTELALMFGLLLALDAALGGRVNLLHLSPHPFWLPVLVVSLNHGTARGIVAAGVAIVLGRWHGWAPLSGELDFYTRMLILWKEPILWLGAAFAVGAFQERGVRERRELAETADEMRVQRDAIAEHAGAMRGHVAKLEAFITGMPADGAALEPAAGGHAMDGAGRLGFLARECLGCDIVGIWLAGEDGWTRRHGEAALARMLPALESRFGENTDAIALPHVALPGGAAGSLPDDTVHLAVSIRRQPTGNLAGIIMLGKPGVDLHPRAVLAVAGALGHLAGAMLDGERGGARDKSTGGIFDRAADDDRAR